MNPKEFVTIVALKANGCKTGIYYFEMLILNYLQR